MPNPTSFSQKVETIPLVHHRSSLTSVKDDEVTSSEEASAQERSLGSDGNKKLY